ncbi:MAG: DUF1570 domain-containing protein [Halioglobus sp.]
MKIFRHRLYFLTLGLLAFASQCRGGAVDSVSPVLYDSPACILYYSELNVSVRQPEREKFLLGSPGVVPPNRYNADLKVTARGVELPRWLEPHLITAVDVMREGWQQLVVTDVPPQLMPIEIVFVADQLEFESMRQQLAPQLEGVSGFYSSQTGQAVVFYDARIIESVRRTAIHELSHLVTASYLGPAPRWLAEGMAEYYEPMYIARSGAALGPNRRHTDVLVLENTPGLLDFLQLSSEHWYGESGRQHYATAWSVIFFLMDSPEGRQTLAHLLSTATANVCKPLSLEPLLGVYPGGFAQLEADWRQWLGDAPFAVNQHMLREPQ